MINSRELNVETTLTFYYGFTVYGIRKDVSKKWKWHNVKILLFECNEWYIYLCVDYMNWAYKEVFSLEISEEVYRDGEAQTFPSIDCILWIGLDFSMFVEKLP